MMYHPFEKMWTFPLLEKKTNSEARVKECFSGMWNSLPGRGRNMMWEKVPGVIWAAVRMEMRFNGCT